MVLLTLIVREMRSRARKRSTYWSRFGVAMVGMLICLSQPSIGPGTGGQLLFGAIVGAAFLFSCSACLAAADVIGVERREGTLGLLFLTRARSVDVLAGKLSAEGLSGLCALGACLPAVMIPVMAGGVTGWEAVRTGAALMTTLLFSLAVGLWVSASQVNRFKAIRRAGIMMVLAVLVPVVLPKLSGGRLPDWIDLLSPLKTVLLARDAAYRVSALPYWISLAAAPGLGLVLLAAASRRLRRTAGEGEGTPARSPAETPRVVGAQLSHWEPAREDSSPVEWLAFRQQGVKGRIWAPAVIILALSAWVPFGTRPFGPMLGGSAWLAFWPLGFAGALIGSAVVAWMASRFFVGARRSRELELLLTTPVGADRIVKDQWEVLRRFFVWPVVGLQLALLLPILTSGVSRAAGMFGPPPFGLISIVLSLAISYLNVSALCWFGFWLGLKAPGHAVVIGWTLAAVTGSAWLLRFLGVAACAWATRWAGVYSAEGLVLFLLPELCVAVFLVGVIAVSRKRLEGELKGVETRPWALPAGLKKARAIVDFFLRPEQDLSNRTR
jgi:hypothetical protein